MDRTRDIKVGQPIIVARRAAGVVSGTFDTLGSSRVIAWVAKGALGGQSSKQVLRVAHAETAATFASATAFNTAVIASSVTASAATANQGPFTFDMAGKGRYLVFKLSNISASACAGVIAVGIDNEVAPPPSTGFASVTGVTSAPTGP